MWRSKAKLTSLSHIPLSHILKDILRQGERYLKEDYRLQLRSNHVFITKTNNVVNSRPPKWLFEQLLRSISKHLRIHNWKNLRNFQLQVDDYLMMTDRDLKLLSRMISQVFPTAQEISLMLPKYMIAKKGVPECIFAICRNVPNLKAFSLYVSNLIDEETITQLGKNIGGYASHLEVLKLGLLQRYSHSFLYGNLQVLDLSTRIKTKISGSAPGQLPKNKEGTKTLSMEVASKLNKLKSLTYIITYSDGGVSDEAVNQILSNTGKRLPNLEELSLVFTAFNRNQYTNLGIKSIFTNISQYLKNLRSLSLDFSDSLENENVNDELMEDFWGCIDSSLRGLNSLSLNFYGCTKLTSGGVNLVCWAIAEYLQNLEKLVLGFENCKGFTPEAVQELTSNHHIKHLKWLTFAFNGDNFDDFETGQAALQLISSFKTLKKFELNIPAHFGKMTDVSVRAIGMGVSAYLKDLECLSLIFPLCHRLTSLGISQFTSDIAQNLKKLKSLNLTFAGGVEITGDTLVNLSDNISNNMVELEELTLNFHPFHAEYPFTDEGIKHLAFSLCYGLNRLRSLMIKLIGSSEVTAQGILYLGSMIKNHAKQLKLLYLEFTLFGGGGRSGGGRDPQIQQAKSSLFKDLWFIPTLHIIIN